MLREEVRTKRLILRPLKSSDYKMWFDAWVNRLPSQSRWDSGPKPPRQCSKAYFKKFVARLQRLAKDDDYYQFGVFEKKTGILIGSIDFDIYVRSTHQFANFGYVIYNRLWGKGYGQESAAAGLKIGFKQLKLNRLEAAINLDNRKSIRLVKAIAMKREGIKKRYWFEDGKWVDHLIYIANPEDIGLQYPLSALFMLCKAICDELAHKGLIWNLQLQSQRLQPSDDFFMQVDAGWMLALSLSLGVGPLWGGTSR